MMWSYLAPSRPKPDFVATMYIKELIIDGFKSYATRTVISGWDREFNAITGLNGSGKSNVLDAICFVLGINNLSQVRVHSLQDLVYKRGQAGITKASVSVVFDNTDPLNSPVGFDKCEEITVTRQVCKIAIYSSFDPLFFPQTNDDDDDIDCNWRKEQVLH